MRAAVIGAGLAGLSTAFFLSKKGYTITLFDKKGIGAGASGIASGLCHPYPGKEGKPSKFAKEALQETESLLSHVEETTKKSCSKKISFLRKNLATFSPAEDLEETNEGILIHSGILFFMPLYLEALFHSIPNLTFVQQELSLEDDFSAYDRVVFALGGGFQKEKTPISLQYIKGQALLAKSPISFERPLLGNGHLIPLENQQVLLGSTYEHHFQDDLPDLPSALTSLTPRLSSFLPPLNNFEIVSVMAGVRVSQKGTYLPLIQKIDSKRSIFTALGSRGLLYHALYGRFLAEMIG